MTQTLEKCPSAGPVASAARQSPGLLAAAHKSAPRTRRGRFDKCGGFTLLEVMVAVAILGIAMTTIHYGQAQSLRAQARTQNVTLATMKAMEKMDEVLTVGRFELPGIGDSEDGVFDPPYDFLHWTLRVEENAVLPEMIKDIHLTVYWDTQPEESARSSHTKEGGGSSVSVCLYVAVL
jgi:general secretion pathway protein I